MTRKFAFNIIYIIDVLGDEDLDSSSDIKINTNRPDDITLKSNTASKLFKSISSLKVPIPIVFVKIHNIPMLISFFKELEKGVIKKGLIPIVHFECHGSPDDGMFFPSIKKYISWSEMNDLFLMINKHTMNNLLAIVAGCDSFKSTENIDFAKGSPYGCYIGANKVTDASIISRFKDFYRYIFIYNDFDGACDLLGSDFSMVFSYDICMQRFLLPLVLSYFGEDKKEFVEYTINRLIDNGQQGSIGEIRKLAKYRLKHIDKYYERSGVQFLHGQRPLAFTELKRIALDLKDNLSDEAKFNIELRNAIKLKRNIIMGKGA